MSDHAQIPANPVDGQRFECPACDHVCVFVVLDDDEPGEWVITGAR